MAVAYVGANGAFSTTPTPTTPTGSTGDILIGTVAGYELSGSGPYVTDSTGDFTSLGWATTGSGSGNSQVEALARTTDGSEDASYLLDMPNGLGYGEHAVLSRFSGARLQTSSAAFYSGTGDHTIPAHTVDNDGSMVVAFGVGYNQPVPNTAIVAEGYTSIYNGDSSYCRAYYKSVNAGSVSAFDAGGTNDSAAAWLVVVLEPTGNNVSPVGASVSVTPGTLTVTPPPQAVSPTGAIITATPGTLTVTTSTPIAPTGATVTLTPGTLTVTTTAAITPTGPTITVTPGTVTVSQGTATQDITPTGPTITLTPGTLTVTTSVDVTPTGPTITVTPGTLTVTTTAAVSPTGPTITVTPGTLTVVQGQAITPTGPTITVTPGTLAVALIDQFLTPTGPTITVTPGTLTVSLFNQELSLVGATITVTPGEVRIPVPASNVGAERRGLGGMEPPTRPAERRDFFDVRRKERENDDEATTLAARVTTNEGDIAALEAADTALDGRLDVLETRVGVHATRSTAQTLPATTLTDVTYTGETQDTDGFFTATSSTVTVPTGKGGMYAVTFTCSLSVAPTLSLYMYVNGSVVGQGAGSSAGTGVITMFLALAAGDTVKVALYASSGGNINSAELRCYRVTA